MDELVSLLKEKHAPIADCLGSGVGIKLQFRDSEIMSDILDACVDEGIVALPIHDSVICPESRENRVIEMMKETYRERMGFDIEVTSDHTEKQRMESAAHLNSILQTLSSDAKSGLGSTISTGAVGR